MGETYTVLMFIAYGVSLIALITTHVLQNHMVGIAFWWTWIVAFFAALVFAILAYYKVAHDPSQVRTYWLICTAIWVVAFIVISQYNPRSEVDRRHIPGG